MISKEKILKKLSPFENNKVVISKKQTVDNIIHGIKETHGLYASDYDKIFDYFISYSIIGTFKSVFDFLKSNVPYKEESSREQTLRSPAAILEYNNSADCKSYALFANGVLDAIRRNTNYNFDLYYRYAGYSTENQLEHVFCVAVLDGKEYWIDPVLNYFDSREKTPNFILDKKVKPMLVQINGIANVPNSYNNNMNVMDYLKPQPAYVYVGKTTTNFANDEIKNYFAKAAHANKIVAVEISNKKIGFLDSGTISTIVNLLGNIFGGSDPNKDWESWDALDKQYGNFPSGGQAKYHIKTMPQKTQASIARTMPNLISWIRNKGVEKAFQLWRDFPDNDKLTPQEIYQAFKIGGMENVGIELANGYNKYLNPRAGNLYGSGGSGASGDDGTNNNQTTDEKSFPIIPLGIGILLLKAIL